MTEDYPNPDESHLEAQARKIISASDGVPNCVTLSAVQAALETSDVDLDDLDQRAYDLLFDETKGRLETITNRMKCTTEAEPHDTEAIEWDFDNPTDTGPTWITVLGECEDCGGEVKGFFDLYETEEV